MSHTKIARKEIAHMQSALVPLYGGAAKCRLPTDWADASRLRQVPDNQEVFVHQDGQYEQSTIIEILEHQSGVPDNKAGEFFFSDIADADHATESNVEENVVRSKPCTFLGHPAVRVDALGTQVKGKTGPQAIPAPIFVKMTVLRSPFFQADILITSHSTPEGRSAVGSVHDMISDSIEFVDPSLFQ